MVSRRPKGTSEVNSEMKTSLEGSTKEASMNSSFCRSLCRTVGEASVLLFREEYRFKSQINVLIGLAYMTAPFVELSSFDNAVTSLHGVDRVIRR
jgi:hypothetical protein